MERIYLIFALSDKLSVNDKPKEIIVNLRVNKYFVAQWSLHSCWAVDKIIIYLMTLLSG